MTKIFVENRDMRWGLILVGVLLIAALLGTTEGFTNFTRQNPAAGAAERYAGSSSAAWGGTWVWGWPFWSASCKLAGCPGQQTCKSDSVGFTFCG